MSGQIYDLVTTTEEATCKDESNTDVMVMFCSDKSDVLIPAHLHVVVKHSPALTHLLYKPNDVKYIKIKGVSLNAISNMIRCFYDKDINVDGINDIKDSLTIAERYGLPELLRKCTTKLNDFPVDVSNVVTVLETSLKAKNEAKVLECLIFISKNKDIVLKNTNFMRLNFESVLEIFENLRKCHLIIEAEFLCWSIQWKSFVKCLSNVKKHMLEKSEMPNIPAKGFDEITSYFPKFFSSDEMTRTWRDIVNAAKDVPNSDILVPFQESDPFESTEVYSDTEFFNAKSRIEQENCVPVISSMKESFISGPTTASETVKVENIDEDHLPGKIKHLKFQILKDGPNPFNWIKRVKVTFLDDSGKREFQFPLEVNENRALTRWFEESDEHDFYDVDVSYTGLHYFFKMQEPNKEESQVTPTPIEYIELLKASLFLEDRKLYDEIITELQCKEECDPIFLNGLTRFSELKDRCKHVLKSRTSEILIHPNFPKSSSKLIKFLLQQDELHLSKEASLLKCIISWLGTSTSERWRLRSKFLKRIAFENISEEEFRYTVNSCPEFFSSEENQLISAYKTAVGDESLTLRKTLPLWYSFRNRKILNTY